MFYTNEINKKKLLKGFYLLFIYLFKQNNKLFIINRVVTERSKICTNSSSSSSNETSINDEYPRLNNYNSNLNTISYPRELIMISKGQKNTTSTINIRGDDNSSEMNSHNNRNSEHFAEHTHINYAYNLTFNSSDTVNNNKTKLQVQKSSTTTELDNNNSRNSFNLKAFWKNNEHKNTNLDNKISDRNKKKLEVAKIINNIPHSFEKHMAINFHNLTYNSSPANSNSLETGSDFINHYSKYTDSTSISTEQQSLKDEVNYIFKNHLFI
jgi:hypothetical protein